MTEQLATTHERLRKRLKQGQRNLDNIVDAMTENMQNFLETQESATDEEFGGRITELFNKVIENEPLKKVTSEHKEQFAYISRLGKAIDGVFSANPETLNVHKSEQLEQKLIDEAVNEYFVREGFFQESETFVQERDVRVNENLSVAMFKEIYNVIDDLQKGNIELAMEWVQSHADLLQGFSSQLLFKLHKLRFLQILRTRNTQEALNYAKANLQRFQHTHLQEISKLMSACLFVDNPEESPYKEMFDPEQDFLIGKELIQEWFRVLDIPQQSSLLTTTKAGCQVTPDLIQLSSLINEKMWQNPIPVELTLTDDLRFHSVFVCPVSKEVTTPDNPPMLLPCGHLIGRFSMERLLASSVRRKFKCPTCPIEISEADVMQIYF